MCIPSVEYWLRQFLRSYPLLRGVFFFISTSEFFMLLYSVKFADILFKFTVIPSMANYILPFPHFLSSEPLDECLLHLALHVDSHLGWIRCCLPPTPKFSFSSWQQGDQPTVSSKHWTVFHDSPHMLEIKCSAMIFLTLFFTCKPQYIHHWGRFDMHYKHYCNFRWSDMFFWMLLCQCDHTTLAFMLGVPAGRFSLY